MKLVELQDIIAQNKISENDSMVRCINYIYQEMEFDIIEILKHIYSNQNMQNNTTEELDEAAEELEEELKTKTIEEFEKELDDKLAEMKKQFKEVFNV